MEPPVAEGEDVEKGFEDGCERRSEIEQIQTTPPE
jgi:hypothetical protein